MADVEMTGTERFLAVAKRYNAMGKQGRGLFKELNSSISDAAEPMVDHVKGRLSSYLPDRYARVLQSRLTVRVSRATRGASIGLKLVGTAAGRSKKRRIRTLDQGTLRHPVYHMGTWVNQSVKAGFWTEPMEQSREIPERIIAKAVRRAFNRL